MVANSPNYLDNLYGVYPIQQSGTRPLHTGLWAQIQREYNAGNWESVIELLIDSRNDIFPIKDGYVDFGDKTNRLYLQIQGKCKELRRY